MSRGQRNDRSGKPKGEKRKGAAPDDTGRSEKSAEGAKRSAPSRSGVKRGGSSRAKPERSVAQSALPRSAQVAPPPSDIEPESLVGHPAPDFELEGPGGRRVRLADFAGKTLVLYFYPKDDTPGCTLEARDFDAARAAFARRDAEVVGVSRDSAASHARFCAKHGLSLTLLSDPDATALRAYGAWQEKNSYGKRSIGTVRTTFVIDRQGVVRRVFPRVKVAGHVDAVLASLAESELTS